MTRDELIQLRGPAWERLSSLLASTSLVRKQQWTRGIGPSPLTPEEMHELSSLYRSLAGDLMRVRRDKLGADLEQHLDGLASRAHNLIYSRRSQSQRFGFVGLILDFPSAVRRNHRLFFLAFALFFGPGVVAGVASYVDESYALALLDESQLQGMEQMYKSASPGLRDTNTDAKMTGFYVWNNVGIAFRCFSTGLLFGLGSMFYLLFNGLTIGVVFGHLFRIGLGVPFGSFVSTHSPWELIAIVISGGAGLQMGLSLVITGGRTRLGNLQAKGLELLRQILGAAMFLLIAAVLEGNVSPSALPPAAKYVAGGLGWFLVATILIFSGRDRSRPADVKALDREAVAS